MNKLLLSIIIGSFLLGFNLEVYSQDSSDSLSYKRHIFNSTVYVENYKLPPFEIIDLYARNNSNESYQLLRKANRLRLGGAIVGVAGLGLSVDALIGEKRVAVVNNTEHVYYKRPIFQLLGGLGLIATGVSLLEYGNDAKIKSIKIYNKRLKQLNTQVILSPNGDLGLSINF